MALDLNDKTANNNNLTNNGGDEVTTSLPFAGKSEAVRLVDANGDYLTAADSATLSLSGNFTIELWVKLTTRANSVGGLMVCKVDVGAAKYAYRFIIDDVTEKLQLIVSDDGTINATHHIVSLGSTVLSTTDTWYHVAVSFTAATSAVKFYVNGAEEAGSNTGTVGTTVYNGDNRLLIGAQDNSGSPIIAFDGTVTEIRVWNTVRTQAQINDNKNTELNGDESGLVAYWPFETPVPTPTTSTTNGSFLFNYI